MMLSVIDIKLWLSAVVETEVTVGAVVSVVEDELSEVLVELSKESSEELSDDEVELSVLAVLLSSLLLQEKTVRLKRNMEKMMSICFTWFPISGLGKPKLYQNMWCFTIKWGFYLEVV